MTNSAPVQGWGTLPRRILAKTGRSVCDVLTELYVEREIPLREIAKHLNEPRSGLYYWVVRCGLIDKKAEARQAKRARIQNTINEIQKGSETHDNTAP